MKPIEAEFRNGHLYDLKSQEVITLREEAKVILIVESEDYVTSKPVIKNNFIPDTQTFKQALLQTLKVAQNKGLKEITVNAGELHRQVGGYPGTNNRMATCTMVLKNEMTDGDIIIKDTNKGAGASVTIKYILPR